MLNNLIKIAFLIVAICATFLLYGVYSQMEAVKYQMVSSPEGAIRIINVKTGKLYFFNYLTGYYTFNEKRQKTYFKRIPE